MSYLPVKLAKDKNLRRVRELRNTFHQSEKSKGSMHALEHPMSKEFQSRFPTRALPASKRAAPAKLK